MEPVTIHKHVSEAARTIFSYCLARTHSKEEAEDLSQDILIEILKSACNIRNDKAFYSFMWSVANNVYKNWCKKKTRQNQTFSELDDNLADEGEGLDNHLIKNDEVNLLRRELSFLSEKYRTAAVLYYSHGYPVSKVSKTLSVSENMAKYLLFKARKILKEGIGMEREFGEKSYNPGKFEYHVVFDGMANPEYENLFKRKIPGNILLTAYYTPMTVRELSIEMGISSVYMEDEIALLEKYDLIKQAGECKYQTNIVIFTEDYVKEWLKMLDKNYTSRIGEVIGLIKTELPEIRKVGFRGCDLSDNSLLWTFYMLTIFNVAWTFSNKKSREIYRGATGTIYGSDNHEESNPYHCNGFAGTNAWGSRISCTYANFDVLGYDLNNSDVIKNNISETQTNRDAAKFPIFDGTGSIDMNTLKDDEYGKTVKLLKPAIYKMIEVYESICNESIEIMSSHAPKFVVEQVKPVIHSTLLFESMGWLGVAAINSGALKKPGHDEIVSVCGYLNN